MVQGRQTGAAFRPSAPTGGISGTPSRTQTIALLAGVVVIALAVAIAAFVVKPSKARSFDLFYGSVFINDNTGPVGVDLASGKPTIRLLKAYASVSAKNTGQLDVVSVAGGNTLMLNPSTGEFNMVDSTGFVVKTTDGGVQLPQTGATTAVPAQDSAYLLHSTTTSTSIYLVGEATVSSAIGRNAQAKARAYGTVDQPVADLSAPATSANGDLWLLTDTTVAGQHVLTHFSVPAGSNAGATLTRQGEGTIVGVAALGSATRNADGTGGEVAAVAAENKIEIFDATTPTDLPVNIGAPVTDILATRNSEGALTFLYRTAAGWSLVTAPATGVGSARVVPLTAIGTGAQLVAPAQSDGRVYTMDTSGAGNLWEIDPATGARQIPGATTYPVLAGEKGDLSQAEVVARGSRVVFNARANYEAIVVYSDGSHPPRAIDKHSAVQVDPTSAERLAESGPGTKATKPSKGDQKPPTQNQRPPPQSVNDKIDCKTATQTPHIPVLYVGDRAARSVVLTWTYPLLERTDCAPSTYVVSVKVLTNGAPSAPSTVTVQGQNGVTLTGLFPATEYEVSVTAYLNSRGTASKPVRVATGPEGPAAPTDVRAVPTPNGDWTVSWSSCGGVKQGCVQATSWNIVPKYCDNRGLSNVPATLAVTEDPTVHSFTHTYPGGDALLGRGLCFAVQGVSPQGTDGTISEFTPVSYSWSPPLAGELELRASQPGNTALGGSASTSVDLILGGNPVRTVGGLGATITFTLDGPDGTKTKTITYDGRSDEESASFPGIQAGAQYTAQAVVHPPNHPEATATTPKVPVATRADWPNLSTTANCPADDGPIVLSCTLTVRIGGISSAAANGENFTLVGPTSAVECGSTSFALKKDNFDPGTDVISTDVDLLQYNGTCTVSLALREGATARDPAVFGGTTSPTFSTTVNLGRATTLDANGSDFAAQWSDHGGSSMLVQYIGDKTDTAVAAIADRWELDLSAPDGTPCGSASQQPTHDGVYIGVNPASCIGRFGDSSGWQVSISYFDRNTSDQHQPWNQHSVGGTPPGYIPCTVSQAQFNAAWEGTFDAPDVLVTYGGDQDGLAGCGNIWTYELHPAIGATCGRAAGHPDTDGVRIQAKDCTIDPPLPGWAVDITYTDAAGAQQTFTVSVPGTPPPSPLPTPGPSPS